MEKILYAKLSVIFHLKVFLEDNVAIHQKDQFSLKTFFELLEISTKNPRFKFAENFTWFDWKLLEKTLFRKTNKVGYMK